MKTFEELPSHSRVWVYQASRQLKDTEVKRVEELAASFIIEWTSHGKMMDASIRVYHDLFIVIAVDEKSAPASGCGIDKSVHFIKGVEKEFNIALLDRTVVAYRENGGIKLCPISDLSKLPPSAIIFNNLVSSKGELENSWEQKAGESWVSRFL